MGAMKVWDGTTWQTVAPFSERASCFVGPDQPAGVAYAGDLWWDTDDPTIAYPGAELAYNQITANVNVPASTVTTQALVIEGTSRSYDGSPVFIEFSCGYASNPSSSQLVINLWDGATDLGYIGSVTTPLLLPLRCARRLTPTVGTHNYRVLAWANAATTIGAGTGGTNTWNPAFIRVTRV